MIEHIYTGAELIDKVDRAHKIKKKLKKDHKRRERKRKVIVMGKVGRK